jgi:hypothetical protein
MIEVKYNDSPAERAGLFGIKLTLFVLAPQSLDSPQVDSPMVALSHTFETIDTCGDRICSQYAAGEFKIAGS